ncbi:MAG: MBL fold metallo-hydrolase [Myxococcales bacterium]|nr:MBL fold metallo-hydrolase [Myxococcales bacterium]
MAVPSLDLAWHYVAGGEEREPREPFPIERPVPAELAPGRGEALRVTWLGHSTTLLEIDGRLILTDPVLGPRASPVSWMGPKRFHPAPIEPEQLPPLDAILVSHDHYDHLDFPTILRLAARDTIWITALGVGAHLEAWGVRPERIVELDWWGSTEVAGLEVTATPARHFQGRGPHSSSMTHWASWALRGPRHSVWFSGDTGRWDEGFAEIGERFGGFDLSLVEIGAWHPAWGQIHLGPENALRVHHQVRAKTLMPVHWGTFNLALHAWDQPICHLLDLAEATGVQLLSPMMGVTSHRESGVAEFWRRRRTHLLGPGALAPA